MCQKTQICFSPFPTPCAKSVTCRLALEALVWVGALHAWMIHLHHYCPLTCLKNALWMMQSIFKDYKIKNCSYKIEMQEFKQ
jgi:hypothetical protein